MPAKIRDNPDRIAFWTRHVAAWMRGPFTILEYCERHGLSRGQFGRWRQQLREDREREERIALMRKRRCRRRISPMTCALSPMTKAGATPALLGQELAARLIGRRRRFSDDEKRHILGAVGPGASLSEIARRFDLAPSLLYRWRKELEGEGDHPFTGFVAIEADDGVGSLAAEPRQTSEPQGGMEIALADGKRVRVEPGADPEAVRRLVLMLEETPS